MEAYAGARSRQEQHGTRRLPRAAFVGEGVLGSKMLSAFTLDRADEIVDGIPEDRRVVLLGESTHGTEEFYRTREAITKRLVEERGFSAVMFEADWPAMQAANEYIHRLRASPYEEHIRFPKWMWHNQCMGDFFEWAKRLEPEHTPQLFGIDCCKLQLQSAASA